MTEWMTSYSDGDEYDDDPFGGPNIDSNDLDDVPLVDEPTLDIDDEHEES